MDPRRQTILLKDGTKCGIGDVIRFRAGAYALMYITNVEEIFRLGKRVYGITLSRDVGHAAWASDCIKATSAEIQTWNVMGGKRLKEEFVGDGK